MSLSSRSPRPASPRSSNDAPERRFGRCVGSRRFEMAWSPVGFSRDCTFSPGTLAPERAAAASIGSVARPLDNPRPQPLPSQQVVTSVTGNGALPRGRVWIETEATQPYTYQPDGRTPFGIVGSTRFTGASCTV